jgi:enoyl-CoA hydratase/carnithine racemase
MHTGFVRYEQEERVVLLSLDRPAERNAIATQQDCNDIVDALERAQADERVSCVVLTGQGSAFCSGGSLKAMHERTGIGPQAQPADTRANYRRGIQKAIRALWDCELPMISAINGPAIGLGCDIACTGDIRIASQSARFASSFINVGLIPGDGGAWILPRAVGQAKAAELIFTGDIIGADEARACGLVSQVVQIGRASCRERVS